MIFEPVRLTLEPHQAVRLAPGLLSRLAADGLRHRVRGDGTGRLHVAWHEPLDEVPLERVQRSFSTASNPIRRRLENALAERAARATRKKLHRRRSS